MNDIIYLDMPDNNAWRMAARELLLTYRPGADVAFDKTFQDGITITTQQNHMTITAEKGGKILCADNVTLADARSETFKQVFYEFLKKLYGRPLPWGSLTGIKPVKIVHDYMAKEGLPREQAESKITRVYGVSAEKAALAGGIAEREMPIVYPQDPKKVSVYVGVPICPAKCSYCSFVSTVADKKGKICSDYLNHLLREIARMADFITSEGLTVDTLYVGGGTPSVFSAEQIDTLLSALKGPFIHDALREFTYEAGRPDTTTPEKLAVLKDYGVDRICLNPQSMNDDTLKAIGRYHTAADVKRVYREIKKLNFDCVNMDLIVGLNHEAPADFLRSLDQVISLSPENLTVHSLAIKKGSRLKEKQGHHYHQLYDAAFYNEIAKRLSDADYLPYYMYRQKYAQGNGENIGYAKPGHAGIYNVLMMSEKQTIIGIGAGSSGKVYDAATDRFDKVFTVKDVRMYNMRGDAVINKKLADYRAHLARVNLDVKKD